MPKVERTIDVTPTFNYQRHVEILKRFTEKLLWHSAIRTWPTPWVMADFIAEAMPYVKQAISELLADDVLLQIKSDTFPLHPQITFHAFEPYEAEGEGANVCVDCDQGPTAVHHVLA